MFETEDEYTRRIAKENVHRLNDSLRREAADRARAEKDDKRAFRGEMLGLAFSATRWGFKKVKAHQDSQPKASAAWAAQNQAAAPETAAPASAPAQHPAAPSVSESQAAESQPALFEIEGEQPAALSYPATEAPVRKELNWLAIIGFVISLLYFPPFSSAIAIVLGVLGLKAITQNREQQRELEMGGRGFALAAIIIGGATASLWVMLQLTNLLVHAVNLLTGHGF